MKIYISLPISNIPNHVARDNADRIQHALSRKGHEVVNRIEKQSKPSDDKSPEEKK